MRRSRNQRRLESICPRGTEIVVFVDGADPNISKVTEALLFPDLERSGRSRGHLEDAERSKSIQRPALVHRLAGTTRNGAKCHRTSYFSLFANLFDKARTSSTLCDVYTRLR